MVKSDGISFKESVIFQKRKRKEMTPNENGEHLWAWKKRKAIIEKTSGKTEPLGITGSIMKNNYKLEECSKGDF